MLGLHLPHSWCDTPLVYKHINTPLNPPVHEFRVKSALYSGHQTNWLQYREDSLMGPKKRAGLATNKLFHSLLAHRASLPTLTCRFPKSLVGLMTCSFLFTEH